MATCSWRHVPLAVLREAPCTPCLSLVMPLNHLVAPVPPMQLHLLSLVATYAYASNRTLVAADPDSWWYIEPPPAPAPSGGGGGDGCSSRFDQRALSSVHDSLFWRTS
jgi:hypothetical protein